MSVTVSSGYKQSELGEIPENWDSLTVQQLIDNGAIVGHLDGNHGELYPRSHEFKNFGVPYIGANNFYSGQVDLQGCKFLSEDRASLFKKGVAQDGDVLFAHNATVGPVAKLKTSIKYVILSTTATYFRTNGVLLNNDYLLHYMRSDLFSSQYRPIMSQSTRNQVPITAQRKLVVVIPPIEEQRDIASSLSGVEEFINSLDQLIAKKRDIQQAAMQQLLTGQRRLPGFSEGWEEASLGEISFISKGEQLSQKGDATGLVPHFNGGVSASSYTDTANTPEDTIAISEGGNSCGFVQFITTPFWCGGHCYAVRPRGIENLFLYFALKGKEDSIMGLRVGSGLPNIQKSALNSFQIALPSSRDEQTSIATILADMDIELAALETRRDKACQLKQGMMQELLTGRIRLTNQGV